MYHRKIAQSVCLEVELPCIADLMSVRTQQLLHSISLLEAVACLSQAAGILEMVLRSARSIPLFTTVTENLYAGNSLLIAKCKTELTHAVHTMKASPPQSYQILVRPQRSRL